jgi:hypothetical protein
MQVNFLETHDRLLEFQKQSDLISKGCQDCIDNRPKEFGNHPFYIFAHKRTLGLDEMGNYVTDGKVMTHKMVWQSRLTKPYAQLNSMLFKYYPVDETIYVIWMIPEKELWEEYNQGKMTENKLVVDSIYFYKNNRKALETPMEDDLSEMEVELIYEEIVKNNKKIAKNS